MDLSTENKERLTGKGLILFGGEYRMATRYTIFKPKEVEGNHIENWESIPIITGMNTKGEVTEEYISNCPPLTLWGKDKTWTVELHLWVPGPGSGDFQEFFDHQDDAIAFILSYYFGENSYFNAKKEDVNLRRNGLKSEELISILYVVLNSIEKHFPEEDIPFETTTYKKLPHDTWQDFPFGAPSKYHVSQFDLGMLGTDAHELKKLIYSGKDFEAEDWKRLSSVFFELGQLAHRNTKNGPPGNTKRPYTK